MRGRRKNSLLEGFAKTLADDIRKVEKIMLDTGPQKGKHRIVGSLKRRKCPECKEVHYSSLQDDSCFECLIILEEEKRLGRKLTPQERVRVLKRVGWL